MVQCSILKTEWFSGFRDELYQRFAHANLTHVNCDGEILVKVDG